MMMNSVLLQGNTRRSKSWDFVADHVKLDNNGDGDDENSNDEDEVRHCVFVNHVIFSDVI